MKFANLVLQSPIIRSRHDLFPTAGRGQAALRNQPTPGEQLVWGDAMPTSHQAYRHTRLEGLFDHANLLRGRPAPTMLNRRDDLNAIGRIGHRHGCMPHTCQVGDRVRSVRGLSQEPIEGHSNAKPLINRRRDFKLPASITPEYLLQGAAYALEQCGLLLRDAKSHHLDCVRPSGEASGRPSPPWALTLSGVR